MRIFLIFLLTFFVSTISVAQGVDRPEQCDLNGDGVASSIIDYQQFFAAFTKTPDTPERSVRAADINHDGVVTTQDFQILMRECPLNQ